MQQQYQAIGGQRDDAAEVHQLVVPTFVQKPRNGLKVMESDGPVTDTVTDTVTETESKKVDKVLYKSPLQQRRCEGITLTTASSSKKSSTGTGRGSGRQSKDFKRGRVNEKRSHKFDKGDYKSKF
jgi:hypothetical protein